MRRRFGIGGAPAVTGIVPGRCIGRRRKSIRPAVPDPAVHALTASSPPALLSVIGQTHSLGDAPPRRRLYSHKLRRRAPTEIFRSSDAPRKDGETYFSIARRIASRKNPSGREPSTWPWLLMMVRGTANTWNFSASSGNSVASMPSARTKSLSNGKLVRQAHGRRAMGSGRCCEDLQVERLSELG